MARLAQNRPKARITITVDPGYLEWVKRHIGPGGRFGSVSHAFEVALGQLIEESGRARAK